MNQSGGTVSKLAASTGATVGTYTVGAGPDAIAFDGTNIWVANYSNSTVSKLVASTGATVSTYPVGSTPLGVAFDGTYIWVTNGFDGTVSRLLAGTGASAGTFTVSTLGSYPQGIAFDGTYIWIAVNGGKKVAKCCPARVPWSPLTPWAPCRKAWPSMAPTFGWRTTPATL